MRPVLVADYACRCGENPLWHPDEGCVYWTDIPAGRLFRYWPNDGRHEMCYEGAVVGGFTVQADGALLLFMAEGAVAVWRDGQLTPVVDRIECEAGNRFNDVIADPLGRVYCGTMRTDHHPGRLWRLDTDGSLHLMVEDVLCSNGLGFTPDRRQLYYTDSMRRRIDLFDYDQATGALTNRRPWLETPADEGVPDGMTVDAEGCVWCAKWDGGCLVRYAPDGAEMLRVAFPARKVSSVVFGGPDCTDLWVTTAGGDDKAAEGAGAGALFRLHMGVAGVPEFRSRVGL